MKLQILAISALVAVFALACGPGEKSTELKELERLLQAPDASEVRDAPGASKAFRESRQFRRFSLEAWDEGDEELSREYAILGTLRFRTAQAIAAQMTEKERLDAANAKIETVNPQLTALNAEKIKLTNEIANLERQVGYARTASQTRSVNTSGQASVDTSAKRSQIIEKMREVQTSQRAAEEVDASKHAPEKYNRALNMVKSTQSLLDSGQANDQMLTQLTEAQNLFAQATQEAQAGFKEAQSKLNPDERRANLQRDAQAALGASNVVVEGKATRVVLDSLFDAGSAELSTGALMKVKELAKLAQKYDEFSIFVEGYTSTTGSATENLGLSRNRANTVRKALAAEGIADSRMDVRGFGQDRPRFGNDVQNERVEVVLTRQ